MAITIKAFHRKCFTGTFEIGTQVTTERNPVGLVTGIFNIYMHGKHLHWEMYPSLIIQWYNYYRAQQKNC